jgi:hypothetical protein
VSIFIRICSGFGQAGDIGEASGIGDISGKQMMQNFPHTKPGMEGLAQGIGAVHALTG